MSPTIKTHLAVLAITFIFSSVAVVPTELCFSKNKPLTGSSTFKFRESYLGEERVRSFQESISELGSIDVLISRCRGSIHGEIFNLQNFRCIPRLTFWIYEKCPTQPYVPPTHMTSCVLVVPYNKFSGLGGTLFTHIINHYEELANFTVNLKDNGKKLYKRNALLNLQLHLSIVTRCTGFLNLSDQPILAENDSWNNPPRAVAFNYGKNIPEVSSMEPGTFLIKKDERTERYTQKYCETVMRYTCRSCAGSLIANRQQILLSNNRIRWLPLNEYYDLRNFTYTEEPGSRVDNYGFEYSYSIIFACYQTMTKKLLRKIRRKRFPIIQCFDSETC